MKITKYTNYISIEGLEEHNQGYDKNSFVVKRLNGSSVLFLLEIVSPFEVKLNFLENVEDEILIVRTFINGIEDNNLTSKPEIVEPPVIEPEDRELTITIKDDGIVLDIDVDPLDLPVVEVTKYTIDRFEDFPEENIELEKEKDRDKYLYNFEIDYIYKIKTKYKKQIKTQYYIHKIPSFYFSSIYHLKQLASNFELYINKNKKTDFDLKLMIWRYSRIAASIAGLTYNDLIYEYKNSLLGNYVSEKVMLDIISQGIKEINLTPDEAESNLGNVSVTLADLSHGAATQETVTTQLLKVHKTLFNSVKGMEDKLRDYFAYLTTTVEVPHKIQRNKEVHRTTTFDPRTRRSWS